MSHGTIGADNQPRDRNGRWIETRRTEAQFSLEAPQEMPPGVGRHLRDTREPLPDGWTRDDDPHGFFAPPPSAPRRLRERITADEEVRRVSALTKAITALGEVNPKDTGRAWKHRRSALNHKWGQALDAQIVVSREMMAEAIDLIEESNLHPNRKHEALHLLHARLGTTPPLPSDMDREQENKANIQTLATVARTLDKVRRRDTNRAWRRRKRQLWGDYLNALDGKVYVSDRMLDEAHELLTEAHLPAEKKHDAHQALAARLAAASTT